MKIKPYLGITGLMNQHEIREILNFCQNKTMIEVLKKYQLMTGVLVSEKTLQGMYFKIAVHESIRSPI